MRKPLVLMVFFLFGLAAVATILGGTGEARKDGVSGRAESGCSCHGGGTADTGITPALDDVPNEYEPGKEYSLTARLTGGPPYVKAGFNLNASSGILSVPSDESNVQITTKDTFGATPGEATHKSPDSRSWKVKWTGPAAGSGTVTFRLATNSVNGNDQPDALDKWNVVKKTSDEKNLPPKPLNLNPPEQTGPGTARLSWSSPAEGDIVRIEAHKGTRPGFPITTSTKASTLTDPKQMGVNVSYLAPNVTYYFRLRVVDQGGLTADSNEASLPVAFMEAVTTPPTEPHVDSAPPPKHDSPSPPLALLLLVISAGVTLRRIRHGE